MTAELTKALEFAFGKLKDEAYIDLDNAPHNVVLDGRFDLEEVARYMAEKLQKKGGKT